ncbi:hypothetical protein AG1IA_03985 [Rhizoctonia solani AG-1 IA]|uniref:Uncharacterized protein n=1 Tax=Thanatephorus cucumeris (strain AG1-IA) TaxID=983506 RepID=L8WYU4_THACA|nr:hypothetical protein AG1IA_03985 [Rhizoctonia solani AG-1 IA]
MDEYEYSWKPSAGMSIDEFLQKGSQYKPTMVFDDGTKPWIWVRRLEHEPLDSVNSTDIDSTRSDTSIIERGQKLCRCFSSNALSNTEVAQWRITQERSRTFKYYHESIPVRANKKKGLRSKKEIREEVCDCNRSNGEVQATVPGERTDIWETVGAYSAFSRIARDLITGALSKTPAFCLKVATTPGDVLPNHRYLICLYLPDLYDRAAATELFIQVLRTVCQSTGIRPNSAKTDLYTMIGLDSKHPSGIKSTIWNPTDLIPDIELKVLIETYWNEANEKAATGDIQSSTKTAEGTKKNTSKRLRRQESDTNVFDDVKETHVDDLTTAQDIISQAKRKGGNSSISNALKVQTTADSATESEFDDEASPTKPTTGTGNPPVSNSMKPVDDFSSDEDARKPKKIRRF